MSYLREEDPHETNMHPESVVVGDRLRVRDSGITDTVTVGDKSASKRDVEAHPERFYPQWFNPSRSSLLPVHVDRREHQRMRQRLRDVHPGLDIAWHPIREVWQVYIRNARVESWWTKGWERIFMLEPYGDVITKARAKLYFMKPEVFGRAKVDGDRVLYEAELDRRRFEEEMDDGARQNAREIYWKQLPKNISHGAKVAEQYE